MRRWTLLIAAVSLLAVGVAAVGQTTTSHSTHTQIVSAAAQSGVATVYIPGHHASPHAMNALISGGQRASGERSVTTATVNRKGRVSLSGGDPYTKHPLVRVVFQNTRTRDYRTLGRWVEHVFWALQYQYGVKKVNVVAHSLGNAAIMANNLEYGHSHHQLKLQNYVAIAGNFDGIPGQHRHQHPNWITMSGRPHWQAPWYRYALAHRGQFNLNGVRVLNIFGDVRHHSDGKILNASSQSLHYLIGDKVSSFKTLQIRGLEATHRGLKHNTQVRQNVDTFLWG